MNKTDTMFVAGGSGLVGSSIVRLLKNRSYSKILSPTHDELDLTETKNVDKWFCVNRPEYVFIASAKVGGINANNLYPADFIYSNLQIQNNIISSSHKYSVKKLLFIGSSCIYPKFASQPISEDSLLCGPLEPTNEPYAIAKIAGIVMCKSYYRQYMCNFISCMPCNLYGINDHYDLNNSHVLPTLIRRFHEAKKNCDNSVTIWGTGNPLREFLFVDDLAEACIMLMINHNNPIDIINIGSGVEISIKELALLIARIVGYSGKILFDRKMPDGTPRKIIDSTKINTMGWQPKIQLSDGIKIAYNDYLSKL